MPVSDVFFGRTHELANLADVPRRPGLTTILGPGGVGKTRLALRALEGANHCIAWLEGANTADEVMEAVASACGVPPGDVGCRSERVAAALGERVLLLDNAEHVLDAVRDAVRDLRDCRVLVTSQTPLQLEGETCVALSPLTNAEGVRLIQHLHPTISQGDAESLTVALDGVPLALEIASSRLALLPVGTVLARLKASNDVLGRPGADKRNAVDGTLGWSWGLLSGPAQQLAAGIALFDHAVQPEALEQIFEELDVLSCADELRSRSWLRVDVEATHRWGMLGIARRFVRHHADPELLAVARRNLGRWARRHRLESSGWWAYHVPEGIEAVRGLRAAEVETAAQLCSNLFFGAFGTSKMPTVLGLAEALLAQLSPQDAADAWATLATKLSKGAFRYRGTYQPLPWAHRAVEVPNTSPVVALAARSQLVLCLVDAGQRDLAAQHTAKVLELVPRLPEELIVASPLLDVATALHEMGMFDELRDVCDTVRRIGRHIGNADVEARAWIHLSYASYDTGDFQTAAEEVRNLERLMERRHPHERLAVGGAVPPLVALQFGEFEAAERAIRERLELAQATHDVSLEFYMWLAHAQWCRQTGAPGEASSLERALSNAQLNGSPKSQAHARCLIAVRLLENGKYEDALRTLVRIREEGTVPAHPEAWERLLASLEAFGRAKLGRPPEFGADSFGRGWARVFAGDPELETWLEEQPKRAWCVPGLYFFRLDEVLRRCARQSSRPLLLTTDGRAFQLESQPVCDLSRRQAMRRILVHLAEHRERGEQQPVEAAALIEVGWPNERMAYESALTRLYTTLNRLRGLGLESVLETLDSGYALASDVSVRWAERLP